MPREFPHPLLAAGFIVEAAITPPVEADYTEACRVLIAGGLAQPILADLQDAAAELAQVVRQITSCRTRDAIGEPVRALRLAALEAEMAAAQAKLGAVWKRVAQHFPVPA